MLATLDTQVLQKAVALACRAPSVHNTQPWLWVAEGEALRLFVDRHRTVPGTDDSGRDAIISCGAVLDHLRVAMLAAGWRASIKRFPNPKDADHLASIEFSSVEHVTDAQRDCATAILQRRTDRLPLGLPTLWDIFEPALRSTIDDSLVTLHVLPDDVRPQLVKASQLAETIRRDDWFYHSELDWWTSSFVMNEGLPPSALASDTEDARVDVGRWFPVRSHLNRRPAIKVDRSKILVLSTAEDTVANALRCGESLSTVLLECTAAGLATCALTHLIEVDESRDIVRGLIEPSGEPQVLIRAGIAPSMEGLPAATPRNPLGDVLQIR
jgi:hypothetical protein